MYWVAPMRSRFLLQLEKRGSFRSWLLLAAVFASLFCLAGGYPCADSAEAFFGFTDSSPFVVLPPLQAELQLRPIWVTLESGHQTIPTSQITWDLRSHFDLNQTNLFLDIIGRLQGGRFSFRGVYEQRDFTSRVAVVGRPDLAWAETRFGYAGVQVGGEFDIVQRGRTRAGINLDWYIWRPLFNEGAQTLGGKSLSGGTPVTLGAHAAYNPTAWYCGFSPVAEARVAWPIAGTQVTDWEVSLGVKTPETVLGTPALMGGYRRTSIEFSDHRHQRWNNIIVPTNLDVVLGGWFVELTYFY